MSDPEKCLSVGKNFSRREWLMTILILLMMQAGALTASHVFMSSQDVINYISFASTIASLLLAVLAIVYGFYQSESQKRTGDGIEVHLSHLRTTTEQIRSVSTSLAANSSDAAELSSSLKNLNEALQATHSKLNSVEGSVNNVVRQQESLGTSLNVMLGSPGNVAPAGRDAASQTAMDEAAQIVLGEGSGLHFRLVAAAILYAFKDKENLEIPIEDFANEFIETVQSEKMMDWSTDAWVSALIIAFSVLKAIDVIDFIVDENDLVKSLTFNVKKVEIIDGAVESIWKNPKRIELISKIKKNMQEMSIGETPA